MPFVCTIVPRDSGSEVADIPASPCKSHFVKPFQGKDHFISTFRDTLEENRGKNASSSATCPQTLSRQSRVSYLSSLKHTLCFLALQIDVSVMFTPVPLNVVLDMAIPIYQGLVAVARCLKLQPSAVPQPKPVDGSQLVLGCRKTFV